MPLLFCSHQSPRNCVRHLLSVIFIQAQLLCDLSVGEIQPHEIQAQYPSPQRLMMAGQRRVREIVETKLAIVAKIALAMRLRVIMAVAHDMFATALRTANALRPTRLTHKFKTFRVIEQRR